MACGACGAGVAEAGPARRSDRCRVFCTAGMEQAGAGADHKDGQDGAERSSLDERHGGNSVHIGCLGKVDVIDLVGGHGMGGVGPVLMGMSVVAGSGVHPLPEALDHHVEHGGEDQRQHGGRQHAADHGGAQRLPAGGAGTGGEHQRHRAEDEGQRRHQDRAQAQPGRLGGRRDDANPFLAPPSGELDDQDGVLGSEADQHDEADLRVDVDLHAAQVDGAHGTEQRQGER